VRYPIKKLSINLHSRLDEEQLPSFTQWLTLWQTWLIQSMWVTDSRRLCSLPRSCLVHPVDRFDSERWFSSDQVIFLTMFCVPFCKKHAAFKWKYTISGFPVSPGSAEALVRWGGKIKYVLIAYFPGNIFAKNRCNRAVYIKIIASQRLKGGTFSETPCIVNTQLPCNKHCQVTIYYKQNFTISADQIKNKTKTQEKTWTYMFTMYMTILTGTCI